MLKAHNYRLQDFPPLSAVRYFYFIWMSVLRK